MFSYAHYEALQSSAGLLDRRQRGRIGLTGADRRTYLQGLLTNDTAALVPGKGVYAALLTPQGRMISDMRVSELGGRMVVDLPAATADTVRQRFADFIFTEDVQVEDLSGSWSHAGVYGPRAAEILNGALRAAGGADATPAVRLEDMKEHDNAGVPLPQGELWLVRSADFGVGGVEILGETAAVGAVVSALTSAGVPVVDKDTADVCRIETGTPEFGSDMDEHTIPLEAGIEDRAISLTKGCYVGQEVIIRVLHRGHGRVARKLVGLVAEAGAPITPRAKILAAEGDATKEIGFVTSVADSPRIGRRIALGYVHRDFTAPGTGVQVQDAAGVVPATVEALPFAPRAA